jgi:hypothetical protein
VNEIRDVGEYCREIETYLCQKNAGHLIRIVGPAFEQVCAWAARGVPLKVAFRGIDRYCERYYAKGTRRRPVRIEFCEADILEMFDDWRRAVGVTGADGGAAEPPRKPSLASHIERAIAKLTAARGSGSKSSEFGAYLGEIVRDLDTLKGDAQQARGERRSQIIARLEEIDRLLMDAAVREVSEAHASALTREAEAELVPFAARLSAEAYQHARAVAFSRLVRQAAGLPLISYE